MKDKTSEKELQEMCTEQLKVQFGLDKNKKEDAQKIYDRLFEMESKKCDEYTKEDNLFFFYCYNQGNNSLSEMAGTTITISITSYITNIAMDAILKKNYDFSAEDQEDIISAGFWAFAGQLKKINPIYYPDNHINTYVYRFIIAAIEREIDFVIKGVHLTDNELTIMNWVKAVTHKLGDEMRETNPDFKDSDLKDIDYQNLAKREGKPLEKYNLSVINKCLDYMYWKTPNSIENMEDNGMAIKQPGDTFTQAVDNMETERIHKVIAQMGYFEREAVYSMLEVQGNIADEGKATTKEIYDVFKKRTGQEISQKDFERERTYALEELASRLKIQYRPKLDRKFVDTSLELDDSFDSIFYDEIEASLLSETDVETTFDIEFKKRYPDHVAVSIHQQ